MVSSSDTVGSTLALLLSACDRPEFSEVCKRGDDFSYSPTGSVETSPQSTRFLMIDSTISTYEVGLLARTVGMPEGPFSSVIGPLFAKFWCFFLFGLEVGAGAGLDASGLDVPRTVSGTDA